MTLAEIKAHLAETSRVNRRAEEEVVSRVLHFALSCACVAGMFGLLAVGPYVLRRARGESC